MSRIKLKMAIASIMGMNLDSFGMSQLRNMNAEFMQRARGKGRGTTSKSVAMQSIKTNPRYPKPHQGAKECARRVDQGY